MAPRWKLLTVLIAAMILVGGILIFGPRSWFPSFYMPTFMGIVALIFALLLVLPEWIFIPKNKRQRKAREHLQIILALCLVLSGAGELGLWQLYLIGFQYDKLVHILITGLLTFSFSHFAQEWWGFSFKRALTASAFLVIALGIIWEVVEFYSDRIFGTQLFGVYGTQISRDTIIDLISNLIGIGLAILIRQRVKPHN